MSKEYEIIKNYLIPNIYSRPQSKLIKLKGFVIHWVANPKSTAINNARYFNNLKNQTGIPKRYASAHEIIGLQGEVVLCIPSNETAYHVGATKYTKLAKEKFNSAPNRYLYGIEVCHPEGSGKFSEITRKTVVERLADLCIEFNLLPSKDTIFRHYDITSKDCPRYYVNNTKEWDKLVNDIKTKYDEKVGVLVVAELAKWQRELAEKAIENLSKKGYVNNPEEHKGNLCGGGIPDWLYWVMLERIERG